MFVSCLRCAQQNYSSATQCAVCGAPLGRPAEDRGSSGRWTSCHRCSEQNVPGATQCVHCGTPLQPGVRQHPGELPRDALVGGHRIGRPMGEVIDGTLYEATVLGDGAPRTIEVLAGDLPRSKRRLAGAEASRALDHTGVARVLATGYERGLAYVAMEPLGATRLCDYVEAGQALPPKLAVAIIVALLDALDHAHARGVVHGDVRPEHVFVRFGRGSEAHAKLFGFAATLAPAPDPGAQGKRIQFVEAPPYASPERLKSARRLDHRCDLWAVAELFCELVSGGPAFPAAGDDPDSVWGKISAVLTKPPPLLAAMDPALAPFDVFLQAALHKSIDQRPASASAMRDSLLEAARAAASPSPPEAELSIAAAAPASLATSPRTLAIDAVRRAPDGATIVVACLLDEGAADVAARDCPDVLRARPQGLARTIEALLAEAPAGARAYRGEVGADETIGDRFRSVLAWVGAREPERPALLVTSLSPGRVGDGGAVVRGPTEAEMALWARRELGDGLATRALALGVEPIPAALAIARSLGALLLAQDARAASAVAHWRWLGDVPSPAAVAGIRRARAIASSPVPSLLSMAREAVEAARAGGLGAIEAEGQAQAELLALTTSLACAPRTPRTTAIVRAAVAEVHAVVEARGGDYEACERVAALVLDPADSTPALVEACLGEAPWELANAQLVRARVANHRGDLERAWSALGAFTNVCDRERSLRMLLLRLEAGVLAAVAAQNSWPFAPDDADAQGHMGRADRALARAIAELRVLVPALSSASPTLDEPLLGQALGTLGRTRAFLGAHDEAATLLEEARRHFSSTLDRHLNTSFRLQVELDRPAPRAERVADLLDELLPSFARSPSVIVERLEAGDGGVRFTLDLLLRALWLGIAVDGARDDEWRAALAGDSLYELLSRARSHPTELVARHAGELLRAGGEEPRAQRWFALGGAVAEEGGATLQRLARFTAHLAAGGSVDAKAARGSVLHPCFEHR